MSAFKDHFSSQKAAYHAQLESQNSTKKETENVRHYALQVQHSVENGWCNESAATLNLRCNEFFTGGPPNKLKDFVHRRQVKHTSTVVDPSIPLHHWSTLLMLKITRMKKFVLLIYHRKLIMEHRNWNIQIYLLKNMIQRWKSFLHKQVIRKRRLNLNF